MVKLPSQSGHNGINLAGDVNGKDNKTSSNSQHNHKKAHDCFLIQDNVATEEGTQWQMQSDSLWVRQQASSEVIQYLVYCKEMDLTV